MVIRTNIIDEETESLFTIPNYEEDHDGIHCEWLKFNETVVTKSFVDYCVKDCISKDKVRIAINECQAQLGEKHSGIRAFATLLKENLELFKW